MGYTPEWWAKNRERVLAARKARYHTDPDYRDSVRSASEKSRKKQAEAEVTKDVPTNDSMEVMTKSGPVKGLLFMEVAVALQVPSRRLRTYHDRGYLPPALVLRPVRLYTPKQLELIRTLHEFLLLNTPAIRGNKGHHAPIRDQFNKLVETVHEQWSD